VERIADALLFEGYMLYPYRPSAVKNRQRFNFGVVYPAAVGARDSGGTDSHFMQTECLVEGDARTALDVRVRFLQLVQRTIGRTGGRADRIGGPADRIGGPADGRTGGSSDGQTLKGVMSGMDDYEPVDALQVGDRVLQPWQEAVERDIAVQAESLGELVAAPRRLLLELPAIETAEPVRDAGDSIIGVIVRSQRRIGAELEVSAVEAAPGVFRVRARIENATAATELYEHGRDELLLHCLVSAHTILTVSGGAFVSLLDPPDSHREQAAACRGVRSWPVLVGEPGQRDTMLSSPIILYDYPLIAPESAGDLFDGTEIDEILSLRILTMTDEEKREMRQSDERARLLLERTESLDAEGLMRMHGTMRWRHPVS
jgi:hydrogenase maturation protease